MARSAHNDVLDALLDEIATSTIVSICTTVPTTRTEAVTTYMLAATAISAGDGSGDWTISDLPSTGRNLALAAQTDISITNTGTAQHVAVCDGSNLQFVTEVTNQQLTSGGTVTIPTFNIIANDPSAP